MQVSDGTGENANTIVNVVAGEEQTIVLKQRKPNPFQEEMSNRARAGNAHGESGM